MFQCKECLMDLPTKVGLDQHIRRIHARKKRQNLKHKDIICVQCAKLFVEARGLARHIQKFHKTVHRKFSVKEQPDLPSPTIRDERKQFRCFERHCPQNFSEKSHLVVHMQNEHNKEFQCGQCHHFYQSEKHLAWHKRDVHGEKNFKCPHCKSKFTRNQNLQQHIQAIHFLLVLKTISAKKAASVA
jgi:uncharacterized C2H2 Zn-finger protein